ncbi:MAG: hypothetical protein E7505_02380 [Ruminococcus sp.]|nr:hypothetical protein [Ruminococcus sp.]
MENVINRIIEIDKAADKRLNDALERSKKIIGSSEREASDIKENTRADAEQRISEIRLFHKNEIEKEISEITSECDKKIRQLDEAYEKLHLSIEEDIFRAIVGDCVE